MSKRFKISPEPLTIDKIEEIITGDYQLELSAESAERIARCREYLDKKISEHSSPVYGVTTGFGALYNKTISHDQLSALQRNLVMSHACGTGNEVSEPIVKLMLLLKAHALSIGLSGVQTPTVQFLLDLFNNRVYPVVFEIGSLGASGDLSPLAHLVLPMLGLGEVRYGGERMAASVALERVRSEERRVG